MLGQSLIRRVQSLRLLSTVPRFPKLSEIRHEDLHTPQQPFGHGSYFLERSSYGNLPVYTELKQNICLTEIRKVKGDIVLLRNDLQELLDDVPKDKFKIVMESKKILIKGNYKERIVKALEKVF
jgi:large subunit ribosomal protein L49